MKASTCRIYQKVTKHMRMVGMTGMTHLSNPRADLSNMSFLICMAMIFLGHPHVEYY